MWSEWCILYIKKLMYSLMYRLYTYTPIHGYTSKMMYHPGSGSTQTRMVVEGGGRVKVKAGGMLQVGDCEGAP